MTDGDGIRPGTPDDRDDVPGLMAAYYGEEGYPFDAAAARKAVSERLGRLRVARQAPRVLG